MGRERIIERERRWAVPAAIGALFALALYVISLIIQQSADLYSGASEADQLRSLNDHSGTVLASSVIRAVSFLALPVPLLYLFRAAQARNPRVQAAMVGFIFIGPLLFAAQGIVQAAGAGQAGSDFVEQAPSEASATYAEFQKQLEDDPKSIDKVTIYTGPDALEVEQAGGAFYKIESFGKLDPTRVESDLPGRLDEAGVSHETDTDAASRPGDALATHVTDDSTALQVSQAVVFPAVLGMVVMMIYVPLQAQRAGLLSRFFGSLGMALGASMILILPIALLAVLMWTGYLGLLFVGRVPGGRPPAWEAGEAIPWPRPGEEGGAGPQAGGAAIDSEARELSTGGERSSGSGRRARAKKRKRKQRR